MTEFPTGPLLDLHHAANAMDGWMDARRAGKSSEQLPCVPTIFCFAPTHRPVASVQIAALTLLTLLSDVGTDCSRIAIDCPIEA
jgi:hypothetical protein